MTYARSARRIALRLACIVTCEDCRVVGSMCVSARAGNFLLSEFEQVPQLPKGASSVRLPYPVFLVLLVCTVVRVQCFHSLLQATIVPWGGCFTTGVGWGLFVPLPSLLLRGLGDVLLFTLREDCKRRTFLDRVVALVGVAISVGDQQLTSLEAYNGARSFYEICA